MNVDDRDWQARSACKRETPDAPELWTTDRRPPRPVLVWLERMCEGCPVKRECAQAAVDSAGQAGMYAGRHIPERRSKLWDDRMDELRAIAGNPSPAADIELLAVPA